MKLLLLLDVQRRLVRSRDGTMSFLVLVDKLLRSCVFAGANKGSIASNAEKACGNLSISSRNLPDRNPKKDHFLITSFLDCELKLQMLKIKRRVNVA